MSAEWDGMSDEWDGMSAEWACISAEWDDMHKRRMGRHEVYVHVVFRYSFGMYISHLYFNGLLGILHPIGDLQI